MPLANLAVSGLSSAIIALVFDLEKLVEFMSIGTLLAYTIVSASVIMLRYRPDPTPASKQPQEGDDISISSASTQSEASIISESSVSGRLKSEYSWLSHCVGNWYPGCATSVSVFLFTCFSAALCIQVHFSYDEIVSFEWWALTVVVFIVTCLIGCLLVISAHHQNRTPLKFQVPWVPVIPALSILCNVALMVHLNVLTWARFIVWMTLGLLVYFLYGIRHSKESDLSYSMLMTSSEASKMPWGAVTPAEGSHSKKPEDKMALIDEAAE